VNPYDEDPSIFNSVIDDQEVVIDRPVEQVWAQFLDIGSWVTSHQIEELPGPRRELGAITRVTSIGAQEAGYPPAYYHYCKVIRFVPERQYVLKTYSEKGGSYGMKISAFDDARFFAIGNATKVTFTLFGEFKGKIVMEDPAVTDTEGSREGMIRNLHNLKRIVEAR